LIWGEEVEVEVEGARSGGRLASPPDRGG
jgi:hypothetical protein